MLRQQSSATGALYFAKDHLGSTVALTNATGAVVERAHYDAFGATSQSSLSRYGFTGRERDNATGLLYYRARWYDPTIGRFISEDPIGYGGGDLNLYSYVWQNPINNRDPFGLDGWGNDVADWLDQRIDVARQYWQYNEQEWVANGVNNTIADVSHGVADLFRVGSGTGDAMYADDNGYGRAANIAMDISRASAIFGIIGGGAGRFSGAGRGGIRPGGGGRGGGGNGAGGAGAESCPPGIPKPAPKGGPGRAGPGRGPGPGKPGPAGDMVDLTDPKARTHILDGDGTGGGHRPGTGRSGKSEFPSGWSDEKILHNISDVATDPASTRIPQGNGRIRVEGTREGVNIRVIVDPNAGGRIVTGHPTNLPRNP